MRKNLRADTCRSVCFGSSHYRFSCVAILRNRRVAPYSDRECDLKQTLDKGILVMSAAPKIFEPRWRQFGVPHSMLNALMPETSLLCAALNESPFDLQIPKRAATPGFKKTFKGLRSRHHFEASCIKFLRRHPMSVTGKSGQTCDVRSSPRYAPESAASQAVVDNTTTRRQIILYWPADRNDAA